MSNEISVKTGLSSDSHGGAETLCFEGFTLDLGRRTLRQGTREVHLHPRAFDTLRFFVLRPGRLLSKNELLAGIWSDAVVGENNLAQTIREVREALGDDVHQPRFIRTVSKRGYIFLPPVTPVTGDVTEGASPAHRPVDRPADAAPAAAPTAAPVPPQAARRPARRWLAVALAAGLAVLLAGLWAWRRWGAAGDNPNPIAVLAFQVEGGDARLGWLERGLSDMVITDLVQDSHLHVLSYARVLDQRPAAAGAASAVGELNGMGLARRAGARTVISGSYLPVGEGFQLDVRVTRVRDGEVMDSLRAEGSTEAALFHAVDDVCARLRTRLAPREAGAAVPASYLPTHSLAAYQHYIAGLDARADGSRTSLALASDEFSKALRLDPGFTLASLHLNEVLDQERFWDFPQTAARESAPLPTAGLAAPVRLLAEARTAAPAASATRLQDLQTLQRDYPDFAMAEGVPVDLVVASWEAGDLNQAIAVGQHYAQDANLAAFYRVNLNDALGRLYANQGQYARAAQALEEAEKLRWNKAGEGYLQHRYWLGRMYAADGRPAAARAVYAEILPRVRALKSGRLLSDLAWGEYVLDDVAQARQLVAEAIQMSPDWWNAYHLQGWLELTAGQPARAAAAFAHAYQLSPDHDLPSLYYQGVAEERAGLADAARHTFERLRQAAAQGTWGTASILNQSAAIQQLTLALADAHLGNAAAARREVEQALPASAGNGEQLYACALVFAALHDPAQARTALHAALAAGYRNLRHIRDNPELNGIITAGDLQP